MKLRRDVATAYFRYGVEKAVCVDRRVKVVIGASLVAANEMRGSRRRDEMVTVVWRDETAMGTARSL